MKIRHFATLLSSTSLLSTGRLLVLLALAVIFLTQSAAGQHPVVPKLTLSQVEQLVSNKVPDSTLSAQIQKRGLAFAPTPAILESLRSKGAGALTLAAVEELFPKGTRSAEPARIQSQLGHGFNKPQRIGVDRNGNVFVTELGPSPQNYVVLKMISVADGNNSVKTLTSYPNATFDIAVDEGANVFFVGGGFNEVASRVIFDSYRSLQSYISADPYGVAVAVDARENIFVVEFNGLVKEFPVGCLNAGCGKTLGGGFQNPNGIAVDGIGNVIVTEQAGILKVIPPSCTSASCVRILSSSFKDPGGVAADKNGDIFVADTGNNAVKEIPLGCRSDGCIKILGRGFIAPSGIAADKSGSVFVADTGNNRVVELKVPGPNASVDAKANPAPFFGIWNKSGFHGGYVKVIISGNSEKPRVHLWGAASPQDTDDGEEDAVWDGSALTATFQQDGRPTVYRFTLDQNANLQLNCHYVRPNGTEGDCVSMSYTR
jgi:hypothetical protein